MLRSFLNTYMTNKLSYFNKLDDPTVIFRGIRSDFDFLFHFFFSMKFL